MTSVQHGEADWPPVTVFTKPWRDISLEQLADIVAGLGADGVELPVRPGYQVTPETVTSELQRATAIFARSGLRICSIAAEPQANIVAACGDAGIPVLRTMAPIDPGEGFAVALDRYRRSYSDLIPLLDASGVTIGVQNHFGNFIGSAVGLLHLIEPFEPMHVAGVLDMAHCSVAGEPIDLAVDILKGRLCPLVNFKSAYMQRVSGDDALEARYAVRWGTYRQAAYSWRALIEALGRAGFKGAFCLPLEYSDSAGQDALADTVLPSARQDIAYLRQHLVARI